MAPDPQFWERERLAFEAAFAGLTIDILLASGEAGAAALPAGYAGLVDWDLFNRAALDWSRIYFGTLNTAGQPVAPGAYAWAKALSETTRRQFMREFEAWIISGEPLPVFEKRITPLFSKERARRIAATEVTRIYDAGNMTAWAASGVVDGTIWQTSRDERVCFLCRPLHGKLIDFGQGYTFSPDKLAQSSALRRAVAAQGGLIWGPPGHVGCRCWRKPVVFDAYDPAAIEAMRWKG